MRIVAVQTGLQADSVVGGETTDREVLTRLADRGIEIHVLAAEDREIMQHANLVPHYYKRRFYKRVPYRRNPNVTIALRSLLADLDRVDGVRFNSPYGAALDAGSRASWPRGDVRVLDRVDVSPRRSAAGTV